MSQPDAPPMNPALARAALLDIVRRMSDAEVVAMMRIFCSRALESTTQTPTDAPQSLPRSPSGEERPERD